MPYYQYDLIYTNFNFLFYQLKHEVSDPVDTMEDGEEDAMAAGNDTASIEALKTAFESVEVSAPAVAEQLLSHIVAYLQQRYTVYCMSRMYSM